MYDLLNDHVELINLVDDDRAYLVLYIEVFQPR